mmetsp:Transcript_21779/g.44475  ORF Transcript_21779/g.44475 Transcript_21779/m.44475 type:complete len:599 (+) Transcript_21779:153-1949(+)
MNETATVHSGNIDEESAPFEWLTNFRSLRHLIFPSRIIFDNHSADAASPADAQTDSEDNETESSAWIDDENDRRNTICLNALHVGCGTSTVGESLWNLRETRTIDATKGFNTVNSAIKWRGKKVQLRYGHVLNVDVDKEALGVMECRWNRRQSQRNDVHDNKGSKFYATNFKSNSEIKPTIAGMEWSHLDFGDESSCRSALDPIYSRLHHRRENYQENIDETTANLSTSMLIEDDAKTATSYATIEKEDWATTAKTTPALNSRISSLRDRGGYFDLVLDKSTLDCLLCSETEVVTGLLCEVYRALRVPGVHFNNKKVITSDAIDGSLDWGGVYVLVTFHPKEFIEKLLVDLPGAEWDVVHEVVTREVEDIVYGSRSSKCNGARSESEATSESQKFIKSNSREHHLNDTADSSSSAWATGTFQPDENYRRNVNVFTCRRRRCFKHQNQPSLLFTLDREKVRRHIEQTCDEWYRQTNPMVTAQREEEIRLAFSRELSSIADGSGERSKLASHDKMLDLNACYEILFTVAEKEHLTFEYFFEDWEAYFLERHRHLQGKNESDVENKAIEHTGGMGREFISVGCSKNRMTVEVALDFLREMQ